MRIPILGSHNVFNIPKNIDVANVVVHASRSLQEGPTVVKRASAATSSECTSNQCKTPAQQEDMTHIIIGLMVGVPVAAAIIVLFFLHRRVKRKQRLEDKNDKYKSYDFGLEDVAMSQPKRNQKVPEMTVTDVEKETTSYGKKHKGGLSLDINSPYLLPGNVNNSGESFQSALRDGEDPYRPVAMAMSEASSVRSPSTRGPRGTRYDNDSMYTESIAPGGNDMHDGLLRNASRMSHTDPFASPDSSPSSLHPPELPIAKPAPAVPGRRRSPTLAVDNATAHRTVPPPRSPVKVTPAPIPAVNVAAFEEAEEYQPFALTPPSPPAEQQSHPSPARTPERVSIAVSPANDDRPAPARQSRMSIDHDNRGSVYQNNNNRQSMAGLRPLPPDDPADNPEQRALRIRSFYKEYFDDSKPNPTGYYPQFNPYTEEHEPEQFEEGIAMYDPETGTFITNGTPMPPMQAPTAPWAEPMARRAFTPPPEGAQFRGRVRSNTSFQSTGHINNPAFQNGPRAPPKKPLPPPAVLHSLPTPHALKDDLAFLNPLDFAPPQTFRDEQLGRGRDSPTGSLRPYSPAVKGHNPLLQSYDDLAALPSPHSLRKSGTFTSLDFAPPPKFKNQDGSNASDTGSIRSARSGISAVHSNALRAGAYRVSRLPQDMVGTKDGMQDALKPSWQLRGVDPART